MSTTPYQAMAPFYDQIMAHVDYGAWGRYLRALCRRYGSAPPARVLELAAGTCRFADLFPDAFSVHSDASPAMLRAAGARPLRVACDARDLPFRGPFDLAFMAYDSLNYLLHPEEVTRVLRGVRSALRPGGLFLFDATTEGCSRRHFADALDFGELDPPGAGAYIRRSRYDGRRRLQLNLFTFFVGLPGGVHARKEEAHVQRVYPAARLKSLAQRAGFAVRACLAGFSFRPASDRSERMHFVLQRP